MPQFTWVDWSVVLLYLSGVTAFGLYKGGKQSSAKDYFLSEEKINWITVALSIVAAETSTITFISVPGIAYTGNFNFLQLAFGYFIGRVLVALYFLPRYYEGELTTAYVFIEKRFGVGLRRLMSGVFIFTRIFAEGVRLYTPAIPLVVILKGYNLFTGVPDSTLYAIAILFTAVLTVFYVQFGGVRAVIWTDFIQLFVYLFGGLAALVILWDKLPDPMSSLQTLAAQGKLAVFNFSFDNFFTTPYQFFLALFGGAFLSMASHGTDYLIVQRLFTTDNLRDSQKAIVLSGGIVIVQFTLFLLVGSLLYVFYNGAVMRGDEVFSKFIVGGLPHGISGLIVAGIFATAMSTLSTAITSISSSSVFDLYANTERGKAATEAEKFKFAKRSSFVWSIVLTLAALGFIGLEQQVVSVALSIASFTYGGLLGVFFLALFFEDVSPKSVAIGFLVSVSVMAVVITQTKLAWTLYTLIGSGITILASLVASRVMTITQPR
jgi:solute:Na+ symporter, SSS family